MLLNFADRPHQLRRLLQDVFVGNHQVRHYQDVAHGGRVSAERFGQRKNLADDERGARKSFADRRLAALDALGQLDFSLSRKQRHRAHLAQVHAHGIIGLVAEVLDEIEFAELLALFEFLVELDLWFFENLDPSAIELGEQIV